MIHVERIISFHSFLNVSEVTASGTYYGCSSPIRCRWSSATRTQCLGLYRPRVIYCIVFRLGLSGFLNSRPSSIASFALRRTSRHSSVRRSLRWISHQVVLWWHPHRRLVNELLGSQLHCRSPSFRFPSLLSRSNRGANLVKIFRPYKSN